MISLVSSNKDSLHGMPAEQKEKKDRRKSVARMVMTVTQQASCSATSTNIP